MQPLMDDASIHGVAREAQRRDEESKDMKENVMNVAKENAEKKADDDRHLKVDQDRETVPRSRSCEIKINAFDIRSR